MISREEFNKNELLNRYRGETKIIYDFLIKNNNNAFSVEEITKELKTGYTYEVLRLLWYNGYLNKKKIGNSTYYIKKEEVSK